MLFNARFLMDKEILIQHITEAFNGVEQPLDITLHVAEAHDQWDYQNNHVHRRHDYFGLWQNIPLKHIRSCQHALSYVEKVGMRFYLPAYMIWYLRNYENSDQVKSDHVLYSLDPYLEDKNLLENHKERFSLFSPKQLGMCALFVKFCAEDESGYTDNHFASKIYDEYWKQFDKI